MEPGTSAVMVGLRSGLLLCCVLKLGLIFNLAQDDLHCCLFDDKHSLSLLPEMTCFMHIVFLLQFSCENHISVIEEVRTNEWLICGSNAQLPCCWNCNSTSPKVQRKCILPLAICKGICYKVSCSLFIDFFR